MTRPSGVLSLTNRRGKPWAAKALFRPAGNADHWCAQVKAIAGNSKACPGRDCGHGWGVATAVMVQRHGRASIRVGPPCLPGFQAQRRFQHDACAECCVKLAAPIGLLPLARVLSLNPLPPQAAMPIGLSPRCALDPPVLPILTSLLPLPSPPQVVPTKPPDFPCLSPVSRLSRGGQQPSPVARRIQADNPYPPQWRRFLRCWALGCPLAGEVTSPRRGRRLDPVPLRATPQLSVKNSGGPGSGGPLGGWVGRSTGMGWWVGSRGFFWGGTGTSQHLGTRPRYPDSRTAPNQKDTHDVPLGFTKRPRRGAAQPPQPCRTTLNTCLSYIPAA